jgi:hypothetical protein
VKRTRRCAAELPLSWAICTPRRPRTSSLTATRASAQTSFRGLPSCNCMVRTRRPKRKRPVSIARQSHLSDEGLSVLPYRCKNSVPPRSHAPVPPRFPGIFPTTRGSGASSARRSFQHAIALVSIEAAAPEETERCYMLAAGRNGARTDVK